MCVSITADAAVREVKEETGVDTGPHPNISSTLYLSLTVRNLSNYLSLSLFLVRLLSAIFLCRVQISAGLQTASPYASRLRLLRPLLHLQTPPPDL